MVRGKELSIEQRETIVRLRTSGLSLAKIAEAVGVPKTTVFNTIRNFTERGNTASEARPGRPNPWTVTGDRCLIREILKAPFLSCRQLSAALGGVPIFRLRRIAYKAGINRRIALKKPFLTASHKRKRLYWALSNQSTDWKGVLFTDEASVELGARPGPIYVSRRKNTRDAEKNMIPTFRSDRFTIMVWAGIAYDFKTPLYVIPLAPSRVERGVRIKAETLTAQKYADLIIDGPLRAAIAASERPGGLSVVEDSSPCHTGLVARERRAQRQTRSQGHPPASPDLNPIENIWAIIKKLLSRYEPMPRTCDQLIRAAEDVWNNQLPLQHVNAVFDSMCKRVALVAERRGGPLKY